MPRTGRPQIVKVAQRLKRQRDEARIQRDRGLAERELAILERDRLAVELTAYEAVLTGAFNPGGKAPG